MSDVVTLTAHDAAVEIAPAVGGAIAAVRWRGHDVLRRTDDDARAAADVRRFACYPLVPYSNRVAHAMLALADGSSFALARNMGDHPHAIHGVGWQRAWSADRLDGTVCLALRHEPRDGQAASWPFAFDATQAFTLVANDVTATLTVTMSIVNRDTRAFPFGLGWHPFFPRDASTMLGFRAASMWETDPTCLPTHESRLAASPFSPPRAIGATTLDNVFTGWDGTATVGWPSSGIQATVRADRMLDHLVVYVPPARDYLAVEPVTHMTDAFNRSARGDARTGTRRLAPGEARSCTMRIVASMQQPSP